MGEWHSRHSKLKVQRHGEMPTVPRKSTDVHVAAEKEAGREAVGEKGRSTALL